MSKLLTALAVLALPASCMMPMPAMAVDVGDVVGVRLACLSPTIVERQIAEYKAHGDVGVQARMRADVENEDCAVAPVVVPVDVQEVGKSFPVTVKGKTVTITVVRFAEKYWTAVIEEADES